jgi:hypothetical protein
MRLGSCGSRPAWAEKLHQSPSQWKKLSMVSCTCHPRYNGKCKIGVLLSRPGWAKKQDPISKITKVGGMKENGGGGEFKYDIFDIL